MKQFELFVNDFVTYAFYFNGGDFEHSEIHELRGELINPIREGYEHKSGIIETYRNLNNTHDTSNSLDA